MRAPKGLTLIEVLIAIAIFAILMLAVTQSLIPTFSLTRESRAQLAANQQAQAVIEAIRAAWHDSLKYKRTCAPLTLPSRVSVSVKALNDRARPTHTLSFSTNCARAHPWSAPAKRVTVVVKDAKGKKRVVLSMDIPEP